MVWVQFVVDTAFGILTPGGVLGTVRKFGAIDGVFLTAVRSADGNWRIGRHPRFSPFVKAY
jgi:hypothetical protein